MFPILCVSLLLANVWLQYYLTGKMLAKQPKCFGHIVAGSVFTTTFQIDPRLPKLLHLRSRLSSEPTECKKKEADSVLHHVQRQSKLTDHVSEISNLSTILLSISCCCCLHLSRWKLSHIDNCVYCSFLKTTLCVWHEGPRPFVLRYNPVLHKG